MVQYTWDKWTNKYISADGQIMWWWTAYKTADGKWSLTKPTEQKTTTTTTKTNTVSQASNSMNSVSQASLDANRNNAKAWTWYVAPMPEKPTLTAQDDMAKSIAEKWNWLDYETQQKKLKAVAWMKEYLDSKWIVSKTAPEQTTTTTKTTTPTKTTTKATPQQQQWDYQDNSQARKDQILNNLNNYRNTNPELFEDASMFYNFFIDWNGRSQEQIDLLWDYFNRVQKYGKYDNLPASSIWDMLVNGKLPDDYLNYLKSTDPQKYQEALSYKQDAEDTIKNESYLNDLSSMAWFETEESSVNIYPWAIEAAREFWLFVDENEDWVDDRLYVPPTEEELTKQNRVNTIDSRIMEIKNMQKNLLDDLTEQYPWVPKATLMWIVQDRTKDLQREYDDLMVERTWLVWNIEYMQNERKSQMDAWKQSIQNIDSAIKTYYNYLPWWIQELAQSKYEATNITLDQADNWTETQQQMALERVLDWYYKQYWDIIQRPEAQVINDVIAYAKKNWVWLSQALQENFIKPLQQKDAYKSMQNQLVDSWWDIKNVYVDWEQQSVWYNPQTQETKPIWYSYNSSTWKFDIIAMNDWWEWDYEKYREDVKKSMRDLASTSWNKEEAAKNIAANMEWAYLWTKTCWYYVNDYIYGMTWVKWPFGSDISTKRAACTNTWLKWAKVWDAIVFDWNIAWWVGWVYPEYWHVGIITWFNPSDWSLQVSSSIWGKVQTKTIKPWDAWYNNIYGTMSVWYNATPTNFWYWENPMSSYLAELWWWDLNADQKKDLKFVTQSYNLLYRIASSWDLDHLITRWDFEKLIQNMNSKAFQSTEWDKTFSAIKSMLTKDISDPTSLKTIWDIAELITLKLRKESWAAISAWEWASWFESFLPWAWEDYDTSFAKYVRFEQDYLMPSLAYAWWDISKYKSLFSPNSPYYKKDDSVSQTWNTSKWTWNITTQKDWWTVVAWQSSASTASKWTWNTSAKTWQWSSVSSNDPYTSLYSMLWY